MDVLYVLLFPKIVAELQEVGVLLYSGLFMDQYGRLLQ